MPEAAVANSVRDVVAGATATLAAAGCDTPRLDAEVLLGFVLGCDRGALVVRAFEEVPAADLRRFEALVARRAAREPVAYIVGFKEFRRIRLAVDRRVLIPRPETELLVEVGLSLPAGAQVADVGTGSGAVALALKDERPDLVVTGLDVSSDALAVARANAARLGLDVRFVCADLLRGVAGPFDAVLANLPYVAEGDSLPPEISVYEPAAALYGGPDGLSVIRRLVAMLDGVATVAFEVGAGGAPAGSATHAPAGQASAVATLLSRAGFRSIEVRRDLAGHERVVVGRR